MEIERNVLRDDLENLNLRYGNLLKTQMNDEAEMDILRKDADDKDVEIVTLLRINKKLQVAKEEKDLEIARLREENRTLKLRCGWRRRRRRGLWRKRRGLWRKRRGLWRKRGVGERRGCGGERRGCGGRGGGWRKEEGLWRRLWRKRRGLFVCSTNFSPSFSVIFRIAPRSIVSLI
ncbi:hypothetical protein F7725_008712 [Dissostichus mawsoni]|uniref:Uncharacterized protein n=1 Tax=Dissostichus mawsoni TaxID=36200 RepID=A0A7J5Y9V7_DISMA|nr:hypothetical protein F7725_008712 [Dissostichus mawsoni]